METTLWEHPVLWRKHLTIGTVRGQEERSTESTKIHHNFSLVHLAVTVEERTAVPLAVHLSPIPTHLTPILTMITIRIYIRILTMTIIRICIRVRIMIIIRICTRTRIGTIRPTIGMIITMARAVAHHRHRHLLLHHRHHHHHRPVDCRTTRKTTDVIRCSQHESDSYE